MKLIIDIDEELYEAYKGKPPMLGDSGMDMIAQAIANGIPYEPKGDLISRSALKEHKFVGNKYMQIGGRTNGKTLENINKAYQQGWNDAIDAIINNAPTVTPQKALINKLKGGAEFERW